MAAMLALGAGCAATDVTEQTPPREVEPLPLPGAIHVYPFAANRADIPAWSSAARRYAEPVRARSESEIRQGREIGEQVATALADRIRDMGLPARVSTRATVPQEGDLMIVGYFEAIEPGRRGRRVVLGFGAGSSELRTQVEGFRMTREGPERLGARTLASRSGRSPGLSVPIAVLAATGNPIGLAVQAPIIAGQELSGRNTIEGAARRTAEMIANELDTRNNLPDLASL
jgi:hypothetical protein